ncbi:hypothetical protein GY45DRAFT_1329471 [Cubamyces sp. BRFM 1775]|nr:hypothetical protein GY45DRAFT_1329471 [Cubamyces sp. BRFM 1775]
MITNLSSDAAVVGRAIVWGGGLAAQQRDDVFESTLFAQAAADKQHSQKSEKEALAWYNIYTHTLGSIGWVVQQYSFTEMKYSHAQGSVDNTVLDSFAKDDSVDKDLFSSITKGLLAFAHAGKDSNAEQVFNDASITSSKFASFQIVVASTDGDDVILTLWAFFYSSDQEIGEALWYSWKDATLSMKSAKVVMTLNSGIYNQVRGIIHDKLNQAGKLRLLVPLKAPAALE